MISHVFKKKNGLLYFEKFFYEIVKWNFSLEIIKSYFVILIYKIINGKPLDKKINCVLLWHHYSSILDIVLLYCYFSEIYEKISFIFIEKFD